MSTSYTLRFSDPGNTDTIVVLGTTVGTGKNNYSTSLDLIGPGYVNYGQDTSQNFLKLLENFAGPNPPVNSIKGQLWYDTSNPNRAVLRVNNGGITSNRWPAANGIYQQTVDPVESASANVKTGDLWVDTQNNVVKLRSSTNIWLTVGPNIESGAARSGSEVKTLTSNTGTSFPVILNWVNGKVVEIISYNSFTPAAVIEGFGSIKSGTNLTSRTAARYNGIAESAAALYVSPGVSIPATGVLKNTSTTPQTHFGTFIVESSNGLLVKNPVSKHTVNVYGTTNEAFVSYSNLTSSAMTVGIGTGTSYLRFTSSGKIGVNKLVPDIDATFDVNGTGKFTDIITTGTLSVGTNATIGGQVAAMMLTVTNSSYLLGPVTFGYTGENGAIIQVVDNDVFDIGTASKGFRSLYVSKIYSNTGTIEIHGSVTTATQLLNAQTISVSGDLTTITPASFNGLSGVTIDVKANSSLVTATQVLSIATPASTLLIVDDAEPTVLKNITKGDFLSNIYDSIYAPGMIIPHTTSTITGTVLEDYFLPCDGTLYTTISEPNLYAAIGTRYGSIIPGTNFNVPDLTGVTTAVGAYPIYYIIKK